MKNSYDNFFRTLVDLGLQLLNDPTAAYLFLYTILRLLLTHLRRHITILMSKYTTTQLTKT